MTRTTVRALVCALFLALPLAASANAMTPTVENATTGADAAHTTYDGAFGPDTAPAVGDTLRGRDNDWAGTAVYVYSWYRCSDSLGAFCEQITGADDSDYTLTASEWGTTMKFCAQVPRSNSACSPTTRVIAANHPDTDGDGVPNYLDACDTVAAPTADGCPPPATVVPAATNGGDGSPSQGTVAPLPIPVESSMPARPVGGDSAPNGAGASRTASLTAIINGRSRTMKVPFGRRATVTGVLVNASAQPIAHARLVVLVKSAAATAKFSEVKTVLTDSRGRYRYAAPVGASRVIRIAYFAFNGDSSYADATDVTLLVAGALTLTAPKRVANKRAAAFSGKVKGRPMPRGGVLVDLQVWFHGKWRTFATPRSNGRGVFRFKYRFTQGAAKWIFRARIRKDSLYPYELGYSKRIAVKVTR
jgi:hypothetical protein